MKTIKALLTPDELAEMAHLPAAKYQSIQNVIDKPFLDVTVRELNELARLHIFSANFTDLLFSDLYNRFIKDFHSL